MEHSHFHRLITGHYLPSQLHHSLCFGSSNGLLRLNLSFIGAPVRHYLMAWPHVATQKKLDGFRNWAAHCYDCSYFDWLTWILVQRIPLQYYYSANYLDLRHNYYCHELDMTVANAMGVAVKKCIEMLTSFS